MYNSTEQWKQNLFQTDSNLFFTDMELFDPYHEVNLEENLRNWFEL